MSDIFNPKKSDKIKIVLTKEVNTTLFRRFNHEDKPKFEEISPVVTEMINKMGLSRKLILVPHMNSDGTIDKNSYISFGPNSQILKRIQAAAESNVDLERKKIVIKKQEDGNLEVKFL